MGEAEIVQFDPDIHLDDFLKTYIGWGNWFFDGFKENTKIDFLAQVSKTVREWVNDNLEPYTSLRPPEGVLLLVYAVMM